MRKLLTFAAFALSIVLTSCDKFGVRSPGDNYDASDSAQIVECVNDFTNPQLMDVDEVLSLKQDMLEKQAIDSAFVALGDNTIAAVTTVLLQKKKFIHKKDIVDEFRRCSDVYSNLPNTSIPNKVDRTSTDLGARQAAGIDSSTSGNADRIISTSYNFRTDTIGGKPVKVKIKTVESYE